MSQKEYDYLIVGAGLFGSVFAYEATKRGKTCLVIDKNDHIGGTCYTEEIAGINVHKYGAHIFRTSNKEIWDYVNQFAEFNRFTNSPVAVYKDKLYNLPFNMNTFYQLWGVKTPQEAVDKIDEQRVPNNHPRNLEERVLDLVGTDVYEKLVKGYTEKQWGKKCTELSPNIISRIPLRFTFDNNYFYDRFQGVPIGGYTNLFHQLLNGSKVVLRTDFFEHFDLLTSLAEKIVYTGMVDRLFGYKYGKLPYRSLIFEEEVIREENLQGNAVMNFTEFEVPYTRQIEHKHFEGRYSPCTVVTKEYPAEYKDGMTPYYPVKNEDSNLMYAKYRAEARENGIILGGSIATYEDLTMAETIDSALEAIKKEFGE